MTTPSQNIIKKYTAKKISLIILYSSFDTRISDASLKMEASKNTSTMIFRLLIAYIFFILRDSSPVIFCTFCVFLFCSTLTPFINSEILLWSLSCFSCRSKIRDPPGIFSEASSFMSSFLDSLSNSYLFDFLESNILISI